MDAVLVETLMNLKTRNTVVNGTQAPDFGLIELRLLAGDARHWFGGEWGVYGAGFFDYNVLQGRRRMHEIPELDVERKQLISGGLKKLGLCLLGLALGCGYFALGFADFGLAGLILAVLSIPGIFFGLVGMKEGFGDYEKKWDDFLVLIPILVFGADTAMFILKAVAARFINASWLPELLACWLLAGVCFRRSYLWFRMMGDNETKLKRIIMKRRIARLEESSGPSDQNSSK
jgi:hypothetical protein